MDLIENQRHWICCQIGAREHYAIPRSLHQNQQLFCLITDAWVSPNASISRLLGLPMHPLRERYHPDLSDAPINAFTRSLLQFEIFQRLQNNSEWKSVMARNNWFQKQAILSLEKISVPSSTLMTLFAYSYAALDIFKYARSRGWKTVLGQIDPGIVEEQLVAKVEAKHGRQYQSNWLPAPPQYWKDWRLECQLADRILVNSHWSQSALFSVGVPKHKIDIIPLAYSLPHSSHSFKRCYPYQFSYKRPLRVLFLGQVILRKGLVALLESAKHLRDQPIEFWIVGSMGLIPPSELCRNTNIKWIGAVPRSQVIHYYQRADVFLFPTLSDGFGLTQLEAFAWRLPIIASQYCGLVVQDYVNGILLENITTSTISEILKWCITHPQTLQKFSDNINNNSCFDILSLQKSLDDLSILM